MEQAKNVAQGYLATASVICLFVTFGWLHFYVNPWIGFGLFLFLAATFSIHCIMLLKNVKGEKSAQTRVKQTKKVLMSLQGVGFACWFFDVISTVFVVNVKQSSFELNPLGWPLSAVGALIYYIPITFVAYYLLYKVKSKESFYATTVITAVTLFMGARNLNAGLYNFPNTGSFTLSMGNLEILGIWFTIIITLATLNIVATLKAKKSNASPKRKQSQINEPSLPFCYSPEEAI
jgi:hypothetical protein